MDRDHRDNDERDESTGWDIPEECAECIDVDECKRKTREETSDDGGEAESSDPFVREQ